MADGQMTQSTYLEIDACPARITAEEEARAAADTKQTAALTEIIDSGAKNCAKWVTVLPFTTSGVTFTPKNDGTVLVTSSAAATARAATRLYLDVSDMESGKYVLTGCPSGGVVSGSIKYAQYLYDDTAGARVISGDDTGEGLEVNWTIDKSHQYSIVIDVRSGTNIGSKVFHPMLIKKSVNAISADYKQYKDAPKVTRTIVLEVGTGKRFTSLLNALRYQMDMWDDNTEFIIKISAGTYDISGAATLVSNGTIDARGLYVMPNTKIIGGGSNNTIINFLYSGSTDAIMSDVSALNAPYECEMRGFSLNVKNIRYAIHSDNALSTESSSVSNPKLRDTTIILDDVKMVHQGFDDGLTPTYKVPSCWGAGIWDGSVRIFKNCRMESTNIAPWFNHDRVGMTIPARFVFEDCLFINREASTTIGDNTATCSLCFVSWGAGIKHRVSIERTLLNKYLTLRIVTAQGNTGAVNDYIVSIGQENTLVFESDTNGSRANDNYTSADCVASICQTAAITAYTPVSSKRWYWIHAYNAAETIKGIALNSAAVGEKVTVQVKGYIPLNVLTASTFTEGTLLGWNGSAYVEDTTTPILKVIGGNVAQIIGNGQ